MGPPPAQSNLHLSHHLPAAQAGQARASVAIASHMGGAIAAQAHIAFADGFHLALLIAPIGHNARMETPATAFLPPPEAGGPPAVQARLRLVRQLSPAGADLWLHNDAARLASARLRR